MKRLVAALAIGIVILVALLAASFATDASPFCNTCHEMGPFYDAWLAGPHAEDAECIDCHVDQGAAARLLHKPSALAEVVAHFRGDVLFPRPEAVDIPDARCVACHESVPEETDVGAFSHESHAEAASCSECHAETGHEVTAEALREAGVYDEEAARSRAASLPADVIAAPGAGVANVESHVPIVCSNCHDLARSGCLGCHEAEITTEHPSGDECDLCHPSAASWVFSHPVSNDCASCHEIPDTEPHAAGRECTACHDSVDSWEFLHPGESSRCSDCHSVPDEDEHPERDDCGTCHTIQGAWAHDR